MTIVTAHGVNHDLLANGSENVRSASSPSGGMLSSSSSSCSSTSSSSYSNEPIPANGFNNNNAGRQSNSRRSTTFSKTHPQCYKSGTEGTTNAVNSRGNKRNPNNSSTKNNSFSSSYSSTNCNTSTSSISLSDCDRTLGSVNCEGREKCANMKNMTSSGTDPVYAVSAETLTEDEMFGPSCPGTQITLNAIVWLETSGILIINVPWRGRAYVGTLLDSSKHCFAPTNLYNYQPPFEQKLPHRGRGKRRTFGTNSYYSSRTNGTYNGITTNNHQPPSNRANKPPRNHISHNTESNTSSTCKSSGSIGTLPIQQPVPTSSTSSSSSSSSSSSVANCLPSLQELPLASEDILSSQVCESGAKSPNSSINADACSEINDSGPSITIAIPSSDSSSSTNTTTISTTTTINNSNIIIDNIRSDFKMESEAASSDCPSIFSCCWPDCFHKYTNLTALRYHESFSHKSPNDSNLNLNPSGISNASSTETTTSISGNVNCNYSLGKNEEATCNSLAGKIYCSGIASGLQSANTAPNSEIISLNLSSGAGSAHQFTRRTRKSEYSSNSNIPSSHSLSSTASNSSISTKKFKLDSCCFGSEIDDLSQISSASNDPYIFQSCDASPLLGTFTITSSSNVLSSMGTSSSPSLSSSLSSASALALSTSSQSSVATNANKLSPSSSSTMIFSTNNSNIMNSNASYTTNGNGSIFNNLPSANNNNINNNNSNSPFNYSIDAFGCSNSAIGRIMGNHHVGMERYLPGLSPLPGTHLFQPGIVNCKNSHIISSDHVTTNNISNCAKNFKSLNSGSCSNTIPISISSSSTIPNSINNKKGHNTPPPTITPALITPSSPVYSDISDPGCDPPEPFTNSLIMPSALSSSSNRRTTCKRKSLVSGCRGAQNSLYDDEKPPAPPVLEKEEEYRGYLYPNSNTNSHILSIPGIKPPQLQQQYHLTQVPPNLVPSSPTPSDSNESSNLIGNLSSYNSFQMTTSNIINHNSSASGIYSNIAVFNSGNSSKSANSVGKSELIADSNLFPLLTPAHDLQQFQSKSNQLISHLINTTSSNIITTMNNNGGGTGISSSTNSNNCINISNNNCINGIPLLQQQQINSVANNSPSAVAVAAALLNSNPDLIYQVSQQAVPTIDAYTSLKLLRSNMLGDYNSNNLTSILDHTLKQASELYLSTNEPPDSSEIPSLMPETQNKKSPPNSFQQLSSSPTATTSGMPTVASISSTAPTTNSIPKFSQTFRRPR